MKKKVQEKNASEFKYRARLKDLPASQGMLQLVRNELKADLRGLRAEMKSGFNGADSRFEQVLSEVARVGLHVEEQNSRNQIVLEGLSGLFQRQERVEFRLDGVENV